MFSLLEVRYHFLVISFWFFKLNFNLFQLGESLVLLNHNFFHSVGMQSNRLFILSIFAAFDMIRCCYSSSWSLNCSSSRLSCSFLSLSDDFLLPLLFDLLNFFSFFKGFMHFDSGFSCLDHSFLCFFNSLFLQLFDLFDIWSLQLGWCTSATIIFPFGFGASWSFATFGLGEIMSVIFLSHRMMMMVFFVRISFIIFFLILFV